jgi:hypothetical protein
VDFTHRHYAQLLDDLFQRGYRTATVHEHLSLPQPDRVVLLRHDVDYDARRAVRIAEIEAERGVRATYYFRSSHYPGSHNLSLMHRIASMGHEVGYHYETLDRCRGDLTSAAANFEDELSIMRGEGFSVSTVCPHGNPRIRKQGYRTNGDLILRMPELLPRNGLVGDAYASIDFSGLSYISDVGVCFMGVGTVAALRRSWGTTAPPHIYLLTHPDYWSPTSVRALFMWSAGKLMRAARVNQVLVSLRGQAGRL